MDRHAPILHGRTCSGITPSELRLFSVLAPDGSAATLQPLIRQIQRWTDQGDSEERLWLVSTSVREVIQNSTDGVSPVSSSALNTGPARSALKLRITTGRLRDSRVFDVDLGQDLELYASSISAAILAPEDTQEGASAQERIGLVADTSATVRLLKIEQSRGARTALMTDTLHAPTRTAVTFEVPTAAVGATIYGEWNVNVLGDWYRGDPDSGGIIIGRTRVQQSRRRFESPVPSATHLQIEGDDEDRTITVVWRIQP